METYLIGLQIEEDFILNTLVSGTFQQGSNGDPDWFDYDSCYVETAVIQGDEVERDHIAILFDLIAHSYIQENITEIEQRLLEVHHGGH